MTFFRPQNQATVDAVLQQARSHLGYRSRAQKVNIFGSAIGHDGQAWAGSFLEFVMRQEMQLDLPNLTATASALAEFVRNRQTVENPRPGDLVFYGFSTDHPFAQPHIGIITDVTDWKQNGTFKAIEGQTTSGLARGPQEADGVYERTRFTTDVLLYVRPEYRTAVVPQEPEKGVPYVRPTMFQPNKVSKNVVLLQTALADTVSARGMIKGKFDPATRAGVAAFQRRIGYVGDAANGIPDLVTLRRLALATSYAHFRVRHDGES